MRRAIICVVVVASVFLIGVMVGRALEGISSRYVYDIRSKKTYESPNGEVRLEYATESVGPAILDPGTFTIVLENRGVDVVLYKAKRTFQESWPSVDEVSVEGDQIQWDDGCNTYRLSLSPSVRGDRQRYLESGE